MQELPRRGLLVGATAAVSMLAEPAPPAVAQGQITSAEQPDTPRPRRCANRWFSPPRTACSKSRLTARQGEVKLDTVARPVKNFLLFDYELIRGTASNGQQDGQEPLSRADPAGLSRRDG